MNNTSDLLNGSTSPAIGKYLERNLESSPYWSPATKREEDSADYSAITDIAETLNLSQLAPSATEFIPSNNGAGSQGLGMFRMQSVNGLNLQAAAWVPPTVNTSSVDNQLGESVEAYGEVAGADTEADIEPMVEVSLRCHLPGHEDSRCEGNWHNLSIITE